MRKIITLFFFIISLHVVGLAQNVSRVEGSPFPGSTKPDTLYYTGKSMTDSEVFATGSLSGILARTKPMIMQWQYFHQEIVREANLGYKIIDTYSNNFSGLLKLFANRLDGYILCDPKSASANVAASLSGALNAVAIPTDIEAKAIAAGLTKKLDVTGKNELWALANYRNQLSKDLAIFQSNDEWIGLVDYAAYTGGLRFFDTQVNGALTDSVYNNLNEGATIYGWWVSEDGSVGKLSRESFKMIPSGGLKNLATFTNIDVPIAKQKDPINPYKVVPNVHTVCFVISDGDHIGWVAGAGYWDAWIWKNDNQSRLNLGFTLSPALCELTPLIYNDIINGLQTTPEGRNVAIAAPSGSGYFFPSSSPNLPFHCEQLNKFMRKADMSIVNVIDVDNGAHNPEEYLKLSNIDALFYYTYGAQYTGMKGKISWYKGKPSIGGRYVFWGNSSDRSAPTQERVAQSLANVLNSQSTNISSESGYSLVPVHIWTENPTNVLNLIKKLNPNVRVVAPDEFVWLIKKNLGKLPMGTGFGLKAEYYAGADFDSLAYSKIDKKIDYEWKSTPVGKSDEFSVRWSGQIQALYSEEYSFSILSNDNIKLIIDGRNLIDLSSATNTAKITLVAGQKYDIVVEYHSTGNSNPSCILEWESATQVRQIVPFTQLYSDPISTTGLVTLYKENNQSGFSAGLKIGAYTVAQLNEIGIQENEISSVNLMDGFKMIAYANDNFMGDSLIITSNVNILSDSLMSDKVANWDNKILSVRVLPNGDPNLKGAFIIRNTRSGFAIQVAGGINATDYNVNINQGVMNKNFAQTFEFTHLGNGVYKIMARSSKKVLTVAKMGFTEDSNIHQWSYENSESQRFIAVPVNGIYYKFVSVYSGMVINAMGTNIQMNSFSNLTQSTWNLINATTHEGSGDGLKGEYYTGMAFNQLKVTRVDPQINFNWGEAVPVSGVTADNYSVRWTGYIEPRYTGTYTFYITSDNGRKLWIDNELVIDKWINDYDITYSGTIFLREMTKYPIKLEYFESNGGANIRFEWSTNYETQEVVPQSQLYSQQPTNTSSVFKNSNIYGYPNPTKNKLNIHGLEKPVEIEIFDAVGRKVISVFGEYVNIEALSEGFYFVNINLDGEIKSFKFLKEK